MEHVLPPAGISRGRPLSSAGIAPCGPRHLSSFILTPSFGQHLYISARPRHLQLCPSLFPASLSPIHPHSHTHVLQHRRTHKDTHT